MRLPKKGVSVGVLEYGGVLDGHMKERSGGAVHVESETAFSHLRFGSETFAMQMTKPDLHLRRLHRVSLPTLRIYETFH